MEKWIPWSRWFSHGKPRNLTPREIDDLISRHASEESLLRYQEAVCIRVASNLSGIVTEQAEAYERSRVGGSVPNREAAVALYSLADVIGTSRFPSAVVHITD